MRRLGPLVFVLMPFVELAVAIVVGRAIGVGWTLLALAALSLLGALVVKSAGMRALRDVRDAARERRAPAGAIGDRALVVVGGLLLLVPGFVTAVLAVPFLLPVTRPMLRRALSAWLVRHGSMRLRAPMGTVVRGTADTRYAPQRRSAAGGDPRVVPGEVIDD